MTHPWKSDLWYFQQPRNMESCLAFQEKATTSVQSSKFSSGSSRLILPGFSKEKNAKTQNPPEYIVKLYSATRELGNKRKGAPKRYTIGEHFVDPSEQKQGSFLGPKQIGYCKPSSCEETILLCILRFICFEK
ncbi:uncharacterized protein RBU33_010444 isoform 2-T3 [Hipposideros larvatus]